MNPFPKLSGQISVLPVLLFLIGFATTASAEDIGTPAEEAARIRDIASEAYVYGLPLVSDYALMYSFAIDPESSQFKAPLNNLWSASRPLTPADKGIPFPNNDTLYSTVWFDLRAEPMVFHLPPVTDGRYFSVMLIDGSVLNYGLVSSRHPGAAGSVEGDYLVVGPGWEGEVPDGISQVFRAYTPFSLAIFRVQLRGENDLDQVANVQAGIRVEPLSAFLGQTAPDPAAEMAFPPINRELAQKNFFAYLDFVLNMTPVIPEEAAVRERLASIGIGTGVPGEFANVFLPLAAQYRDALLQGVADGKRRIQERVAAAGNPVNGWDWRSAALDVEREGYGGDYLLRAALFTVAPYGLNAFEAVYPMTNATVDGDPLDGSRFDYSITFAADQMPPVDTFWSLTVYDGNTRFLTENAINRYLVNSDMLPDMVRDADGSLTLVISRESPGPELANNWLPAPDGPMYLVFRLYGPQAAVLEGEWTLPEVEVVKPHGEEQ